MSHITYLESMVVGLVQGVTELFPVSSLGHNVLIPALLGGRWARDLNVSADESPYLAFIVGLHVATAVAMIAYFWRDWLRIIGGFFSSLRDRRVATADQRLAWMIIMATIPVGIAGLALEHTFRVVFSKPIPTALFLACNGVILLVTELRRRRVAAAPAGSAPAAAGVAAAAPPGRRAAGYPDDRSARHRGDRAREHPGNRLSANPRGRAYEYSGDHAGDQIAGYPQAQAARYPGGRAPEYPGERASGYRDERAAALYPEFSLPRYPNDRAVAHPADRGAGYPGDRDYDYGGRGYPGDRAPGYPDGRASGYSDGPGSWFAGDRGPAGGWRESAGPAGGDDGWPYDRGRPGDHGWAGDGRMAGAYAAAGEGAAAAGYPAPASRRAGSQADRYDTRTAREEEYEQAIAADQRLSLIGYGRAILIGAAQVFALLPGISRDGIVTVTGMFRGLSREDAVRFSFLLSAPVILAAGALKIPDLTGPLGQGIHGQIVVGSLLSGIGAYLSTRFLVRYFSKARPLTPFAIYCLVAGLGSLAYLTLH